MRLAVFLTTFLILLIITACLEKEHGQPRKASRSIKTAVITLYNVDEKKMAEVLVEIADSDYLRAKGLMNRENLAQNEGMFFVFETETLQSFWMKNTPIPLDLLFINQNLTIVSISRQAQPYKTTPIPSVYPAKYVLEVAGGYCDTYGVESGHHLKIKYD